MRHYSPWLLGPIVLLAACSGGNQQNSSSLESSSLSQTDSSSSSVQVSSSSAESSVSSDSAVSSQSSMLAASSSSATEQTGFDVFGISQFYPDADSQAYWDSQHWAVGEQRALAEVVQGRDTTDPTSWSQWRGNSGVLSISGDGRLYMGGNQPRLYINTDVDGTQTEPVFSNVEITAYFQRLTTSGAATGGFVIGARGGYDGHGTPGGDNCDGTTYYARMRNDGNWQFGKELKHSAASVLGSYKLWPDNGPLPANQWIGMKYVLLTDEQGAVHIKAWMDLTEGLNGGSWELLGEYVDSGQWLQDKSYGNLSAEGCDYDENYVIAPGNGSVFIRNTSSEAEYKWVTVREIQDSGAAP